MIIFAAQASMETVQQVLSSNPANGGGKRPHALPQVVTPAASSSLNGSIKCFPPPFRTATLTLGTATRSG